MDATSRAYERQHGQRPVDIPNQPEPIPIRQEDPPWLGMPRGHGGVTSLQELLENIRRYRASAD
jgi:hypothetical protein